MVNTLTDKAFRGRFDAKYEERNFNVARGTDVSSETILRAQHSPEASAHFPSVDLSNEQPLLGSICERRVITCLISTPCHWHALCRCVAAGF